MLQSVEGIYRNGKIDLLESPSVSEGVRVIVTFLAESNAVDLAARGIDEAQAANLRSRLQAFAEDWNSPDMDAYDAL
jgi:hypothetical protein